MNYTLRIHLLVYLLNIYYVYEYPNLFNISRCSIHLKSDKLVVIFVCFHLVMLKYITNIQTLFFLQNFIVHTSTFSALRAKIIFLLIGLTIYSYSLNYIIYCRTIIVFHPNTGIQPHSTYGRFGTHMCVLIIHILCCNAQPF